MKNKVKIKFCGMRRLEDVQKACALGVDALGFIFYPESKRAIELEKAVHLREQMTQATQAVAVVVNANKAWVEQIIAQFKPDFIQFHGEEPPEFCQQFDCPYIKAVAATDTARVIQAMKTYQRAQALLIDTPAQQTRGGTGQRFDWSILPRHADLPLVLAGGLTADNVASAVKQVRLFMVDCASGIEVAPGIKDAQLMSQFIKHVREDY